MVVWTLMVEDPIYFLYSLTVHVAYLDKRIVFSSLNPLILPSIMKTGEQIINV